MLRFLADENLNNDILRGLACRHPAINIVRVQDVGLSGADDPNVLQLSADEGRILLTHDVSTISRHAYDRVRASKRMPGVIEINRSVPIATAIEELILIAECSLPNEMENMILYLPLR